MAKNQDSGNKAKKGVVTSERIKKAENKELKSDSDGLVEITLLKDHGQDKKGSKIKRVKPMAELLIKQKIAK